MTTSELTKLLNDKYGVHTHWPSHLQVDHETYANVCQSVFEFQSEKEGMFWDMIEDGIQKSDIKVVSIFLGVNKGIMFKNVELLLKQKGDK